jgi:MFS family permease
MLGGSVAGGVLAQVSNLGVPFLMRAAILVVMFVVASRVMRDLGFTPAAGLGVRASVRRTLRASVRHGLGSPPVRWVMLAAPLQAGVGIYAFYALQPLLLELWGDPRAYAVAGAAAAVVAGSQIIGGLLAAPLVARVVRRTTVLIVSCVGAAVLLVGVGVAGATGSFWAVLVLAAGWALLGAVSTPVQGAYLNGMIPSQQRATVLSFASLMGSGGGVVIQPALGRVADVGGYPASLVVGGVVQVLAAPLLALSRHAEHPADRTAVAGGPGRA